MNIIAGSARRSLVSTLQRSDRYTDPWDMS